MMHTNSLTVIPQLEEVGEVVQAILQRNGIERKSSGHKKVFEGHPSPLVVVNGARSPSCGKEPEGVVIDILVVVEMSVSRQTTR